MRPLRTMENGHHDKAGEPQRPLFSWPEFMAEKPVKPKGRKAQALSLFEWVVEREREAEPVGAGTLGSLRLLLDCSVSASTSATGLSSGVSPKSLSSALWASE